jgi:hypothetical protein
MSIILPSCPSGCSFVLPVVAFDECAPQLHFGEIRHLYIAVGDVEPFNDWTDPTEWVNRIDNSNVHDLDKIRKLDVIGDLPAASRDEVIISLGRKILSPPTWTINLEVDDLTDENYELARMTGCNLSMKFWYETTDLLFGGNDGILGVLSLNPIIERGQKSLHKLVGTLTWESAYAPERADSPLTGLTQLSVTDAILTNDLLHYLITNDSQYYIKTN